MRLSPALPNGRERVGQVTLPNGLNVHLHRSRSDHLTLFFALPASGGRRLAHAYTMAAVNGQSWQLSDVHVERAARLPHRSRWRALLGHQERWTLRGQGLGEQLVRLAQEETQVQGFSCLTGLFSPETPQDADRLARFYARLGFTLTGTHLEWCAGGPHECG